MASQEINTYPTEEPQKPSVPNRPTGTEPTTKPTTSRPWKPTTITTITTSTTTTTQEPATEENTWTFKPTTGKPTTEDPWAWKPTTTTAATLPTTQSNYHLTGNSGLNYNKKTALHCFFFFYFRLFRTIQSRLLFHQLGMVPTLARQIFPRRHGSKSVYARGVRLRDFRFYRPGH